MGEAGHVADLSDEHCGVDPTDAVELLDYPIPGIVAEPAMDPPVELDDLAVEPGDQVPQQDPGVDVAGERLRVRVKPETLERHPR